MNALVRILKNILIDIITYMWSNKQTVNMVNIYSVTSPSKARPGRRRCIVITVAVVVTLLVCAVVAAVLASVLGNGTRLFCILLS